MLPIRCVSSKAKHIPERKVSNLIPGDRWEKERTKGDRKEGTRLVGKGWNKKGINGKGGTGG